MFHRHEHSPLPQRTAGPIAAPRSPSRSAVMTRSTGIIWLSAVIVVLALVAAGTGLVWQAGDGPYSFTTLHGQTVEMYGRGLYRYDTLFAGAGHRGTDAITLILGIPLLVLSLLLYWRGSLRGGLLLLGALAYFLYVYASLALGTAAYNALFLVYVALFSASLFAFVLAFTSIDLRVLPAHFSAHVPCRGPGLFMVISGLVTLIVWLIAPVTALILREPPERLDSYATLVTYALDLAIITPAAFLAGILILRRNPLGYLIALPLLVIEAMLAPLIMAQTVSQVSAGVSFPIGQIVGPIIGFVTIAVVAIGVLAALLRNIQDAPVTRTAAPYP